MNTVRRIKIGRDLQHAVLAWGEMRYFIRKLELATGISPEQVLAVLQEFPYEGKGLDAQVSHVLDRLQQESFDFLEM